MTIRHPRDLALTVAPGAVATVAVATWIATFADRLPDPVASHWGPDGVDGTSSLAALLIPLLGGAALILAGCAAMVQWVGQTAFTRRMSAGLAMYVSITMSGITGYTLWVQRDLADAYDSPDVGTGIVLTMVGALVAAVAVGAAVSSDPNTPAAQGPGANAAALDVAAGQRVAWLAEVRMRGMLVIAAAVLVVPTIVAAFVGGLLITVTASGLVALLLFSLSSWTVTINGEGLTARSAIPIVTVRIPADQVEEASVVAVNPLFEWGGWGYRTALNGATGVIVRRGEAIEVKRSGDRRFVVTVDDAETGAAVLNTVARASHAR